MRYDLILENGIIVTPEKKFTGGNIAIKDGKIAYIGKLNECDTAYQIYDAEGKHILPGIIDAHVHFRDPGLTEKEDFESGSIAAAFGGITLIADMPNVIPPTSTISRFKEKVKIANEKSYIDFGLFALLTNDNTNEMENLKKEGAFGFKVFLGASTGDIAAPKNGTLFEQLMNSKELDMRVGFHAENSDLNDHFTNLCKNSNDMPWEDKALQGLILCRSRPVLSEVYAIQTAIFFAQYTGAKIHIHHITSSDGVKLIEEAKAKKIEVTAETCPHYLFLTANQKANKVYPPIREQSHSEILWEGVNNKTIDMIASDHAPHTKEEKEKSLWEAPAGLCGVETLVPLILNEVNRGRISINDFAYLTSEMPAKIWGVYPQKGSIQTGTDADFTIVDLKQKRKILSDTLHSKSKTSPYDGMEVQGIPVATIVRGCFVMKDGELTGEKGFGKLCFRS